MIGILRCFILLVLSVVTMISCSKAGTETNKKAIGIMRARQSADQAAGAELHRCEIEHRKRDPRISFPLEDYKVTFSEDDDNYHFFYEHNNPDVNFELWSGHPIHFSININKTDGTLHLIRGE